MSVETFSRVTPDNYTNHMNLSSAVLGGGGGGELVHGKSCCFIAYDVKSFGN